jgi:hypothetical protein
MKRLLRGSMLALVGLMAFAASAAAAEYTTYFGCGLTNETAPSHTCQVGVTPGAFFESPEGDVEYDVCVEFPSGAYLCAEEQEANEGTLYVNKITSTTPGVHFVDWYVEGILVGTWGFELLAPPPPPPPAPVVVSPPPAIAPAGSSAACVRAMQRVKGLKTKLLKAEGPKAKAKARAKLKTAKAAAKRLC